LEEFISKVKGSSCKEKIREETDKGTEKIIENSFIVGVQSPQVPEEDSRRQDHFDALSGDASLYIVISTIHYRRYSTLH
jgi:hypothetical protein